MVRHNYKKKLAELKRKKSPIKVVFLSLENQKWGYDSLYKLFKQEEHFEPLILVSLHRDIDNGKMDVNPQIVEENYQFYKSRGYNVDYLYKDSHYLNLKSFKPDIVFYEQPWGWYEACKPATVSKYALTMYLPYGFSMLDFKADYRNNFHRDLYKMFVLNNNSVQRYEEYRKGNSYNCLPVGYSKLDTYLDTTNIDLSHFWKEPEKFKIIYAPHHSMKEGSLQTATFLKNGRKILELAKSHPKTTWVFKPHPRFDITLRELGFSEEVIKEYYEEWAKIGKVYTKGDYFDIFKSSDLMITDCCSFLGEYLPSGNPVIRPINENSIELNKTGREIVASYYEVKNNNELENVFEMIVTRHEDPKLELRKSIMPSIIDFKEKSADKIFKFIKSEITTLEKR